MSTAPSDTTSTRAKCVRTPNQAERVVADLPCLGTDPTASRTELESYGIPRRLPLAQRSCLARRVALLEGRLFEDEGHLRQGVSDEVARTRLGEINDLRRDLGWLRLDLRHDYVWPSGVAS